MAKYKIKDLEKKYGGFTAPCYAIKINDKEIDQKYCQGDLKAELTADYEASSCVFQIANAFSPESNKKLKVKDDLKKLLKLGNKVEVHVGYRTGGVKQVFSGYIDSIYVDYDKDEGILYTIEALDGKGIMMNCLRSETKTSIKKFSEAVEKIIKKYSSVIKIESSKLDKSDKELTMPIEQHNESDYNFVVRTAKRMDYCFFIEKGVLVFMPFGKLSKEPLFEFDINDYLLEFKVMTTLKNQVSSVTVRGNNEKDPTKPFQAKAEKYNSLVDSGKIASKAASVISSHVSRTITDPSVDSVEKATQLAQAKLNELSYQLYKGKVKVVGIPEAMPGKVVSVSGFGDGLDKKYYVSKVIHKFRNDRFTTECELEVNKA